MQFFVKAFVVFIHQFLYFLKILSVFFFSFFYIGHYYSVLNNCCCRGSTDRPRNDSYTLYSLRLDLGFKILDFLFFGGVEKGYC